MNIVLLAVARDERDDAGLSQRFKTATRVATDAVNADPAASVSDIQSGVGIFCSEPKSQVWREGPWVQTDEGILAFSMPPAPSVGSLETESWESFVRRNLLQNFRPEIFAPNYFGCRVRGRDVDVWSDHLGIGRCYMVTSDRFVAFSNHIGSLVPFLSQKPNVDEEALARFVAFGWYTGDSTPISEVKRIPAGQVYSIRGDNVTHSSYIDFEDVYVSDEPADFDATASEMMNLNANLSIMANNSPTLFLSGGRDSRMTCGTWIGGGGEGTVVTYGDLEEEATIARELMQIYDKGRPYNDRQVQHEIRTRPVAGSKQLMSLDDRIRGAFAMWDGDAAPVKLRGNVRPSKARSFSVSGIGGEIAHGYFYGKPGMIEKIRALNSPMERMRQVYGRSTYLAPVAVDALNGFFESKDEKYRSIGLSDFRMLDYFYLEEKLRRWSPQSMNTISPVPLCTLAYQRMAFRLTLSQQVNVEAPMRIADSAIPGWGQVRTYKAAPADTKNVAVKSARLWNTDPDRFYAYFDDSEPWASFIKKDTITESLRRIEAKEMSEMFESWLLRSIWVTETYRHVDRLRALVP